MLNETTKKWLHDNRYVNFKKPAQCESKKIHKADFYQQVEELKNKGMKQIEHTTVRAEFHVNCYALSELGHYLRLTWKDKKGYHQRYTNFKDDKKNDSSTGSVIGQVKRKFKKRTGVGFDDAFGTVRQYYKRCVIGLFHFDNPMIPDYKEIKDVYKYDFTSHFPACSIDNLPDANTAVTVQGIVEPTEEFPFAFYTQGGFVAEYGKYNTRDFYNTIYRDSLFTSDRRVWKVNPDVENEVTVLMKASQYTLEPEMVEYYQAKAQAAKGTKEYEEAKVVLLKIIGQMEQNDFKSYCNNPFAHLAAVIKARAVWKMMKLIDKVEVENVIQVIVDGLVVKNPFNKHFEDKQPGLGCLNDESGPTTFIQRGHNQYVMKKLDGSYDIAHAGFDIDIGPDVTLWKKSPAMNLRNSIRDLGVTIEDLNKRGDYDNGKDLFD